MNVDDATVLELLAVEMQLNQAVSVAHAPARSHDLRDAAVAGFVDAARNMLCAPRCDRSTSLPYTRT